MEINPCIWFDSEAEEAAEFYTSIFPQSRILFTVPYTKVGFEYHGKEEGTISTVIFELMNQKFIALNGGPIFKISEAISFYVYCDDDELFEKLYNSLTDGGSVLMPKDKYFWSDKYAFVKDKFGVCWQLDINKINSNQKIVPSLLFVNSKYLKVDEAVKFYTAIFPDSKILLEYPFPDQEDIHQKAILFSQFSLSKNLFNASSGGKVQHNFDFNEAISFFINCRNQDEIDYYWQKLSENGQIQMCGWLKDKYGVSWQIAPEIFFEMFLKSDQTKREKIISAIFEMTKIDLPRLIKIYQE
ncbi:MAG: VOC family protein [Ignavibacteria bacterium]|nr:VOC family protein [Ignavibacteria bacterium]